MSRLVLNGLCTCIQLLLNLAEGMSGGLTSLDKLIQRIMIDAQDLIKCTRCNVIVFDSARTEQVFLTFITLATSIAANVM